MCPIRLVNTVSVSGTVSTQPVSSLNKAVREPRLIQPMLSRSVAQRGNSSWRASLLLIRMGTVPSRP